MSITALYDVAAPAKLNLFLHITGRRPDGYHLLQSVFVLIDWCDTLHIERRKDGRLQRHDLALPLPADDLSLRAAQLLQTESGSTWGADISIEKRVPWGAGMGGGSSDAASTLLALNRLWGLNWPLSRLLPLGLQLGADVPFFLGGHNALVEGIGEILRPLPELPPLWLAVAKPAEAIATKSIFSSNLLSRSTKAAIVAGLLQSTNDSAQNAISPADAQSKESEVVSLEQVVGGWGGNDLQPPAQSVCNEVTSVAHWLHQRFGNSRMTGSGSAVFSRAGTGGQPDTMWPADLPPAWTGRMCRSLTQHPLAGWAC